MNAVTTNPKLPLSLSPPPRLGLVIGQALDLVVVLIVADKVQHLRRGARLPGHVHLELAPFFQAGDLLALAV
jgi:hypothetical protein